MDRYLTMYATARKFIVVGKGYELEIDNGKPRARAMGAQIFTG